MMRPQVSRRGHGLAARSVPLAAVLVLAACSVSGPQSLGSGAEVDGATVTLQTDKCPPGATTALAGGADIVVGTSLAMSGPGASSALALGGIKAYFARVNANGGIDGHRIVLDAKDDALDPARAVANVKSLIEHEHVFTTMMQLGTPQSQGTRPMYEKRCVPQLYVSSGSPDFYDPAKHPWSTSNFLPYQTWGAAAAGYLKKQFPAGARVGELVWNSDIGKASSVAFAGAIEGTGIRVVAQPMHNSTAVSMSNQVGEILAAAPDAIVVSSGGSFCTQLVSAARRAGFGGPIFFPLSCGDTTQFFVPLGAMADNVLAVRSSKDPADSRVAHDPDVQEYFADMAAYEPSYDARSTYVANAYRAAALLVDQLTRAAELDGGLTRVNLMNAVWSTDTALPMDFDDTDVVINGDHPYPVGNGTVLSYNTGSRSWDSTGVDVEAGAK